MNLVDLEFKAEDFDDTCNRYLADMDAYYLAKLVSDRANRLLRERLEKAQLVYAGIDVEYDNEPQYWSTEVCEDCTHRARLVCIEEVK